MEKIELRKSLQELHDSIDLAKQIWVSNGSTNCYAYALGLDIPEDEIINHAYEPGVISGYYGIMEPGFSYEEIIRRMVADFNALGIDYASAHPLDPIQEGEWKIALFLRHYKQGFNNFHFLRQREDGIWYHKLGYDGDILMCDYYGAIIRNPEECSFKLHEYDSCFRLRLK